MIRYFIYAVLFVIGLCLAGSESLYFPLPNIIGMLIVLLFVALVNHEVNYRRNHYKKRIRYIRYWE